MDDGFIFYIVLAAIALLSQLLTKRKTARNIPPPSQGGASARPRKKPFSFDDILKEFEAEILEKKQPEKEAYQQEPVREVQIEEVKKPQVGGSAKERSSEYSSYEGNSYETLETDDEDISSKIKKYRRDEHYAIAEENLHPIAQILHEKDGAKKAIILSEILNRKYV